MRWTLILKVKLWKAFKNIHQLGEDARFGCDRGLFLILPWTPVALFLLLCWWWRLLLLFYGSSSTLCHPFFFVRLQGVQGNGLGQRDDDTWWQKLIRFFRGTWSKFAITWFNNGFYKNNNKSNLVVWRITRWGGKISMIKLKLNYKWSI